MQKHFLIQERIHGELACEHEATKVEAVQSMMFARPSETYRPTSIEPTR